MRRPSAGLYVQIATDRVGVQGWTSVELVKIKPRTALTTVLAVAALTLASCSTPADVASENLADAAENFEIERRVVAFNGITDEYLLEVVGRCSIEDQINQLEITCRVGPDEYKKHLLGLSDNVSYFAEQLDPIDVSTYNYRVRLRPETVVRDIDLDLSTSDDSDGDTSTGDGEGTDGDG